MPQIPCRHAHKSPQTLPSLSWSTKEPHRHFSESRCFLHHQADLTTLMIPQPLLPLVLFQDTEKRGQLWIWMAPWSFPFFQFLGVKTLTQRNSEKLKIHL